MRVYLATRNAGKVREFRSILAGTAWQVETFAGYGDVDEGETSYAENASLKARWLRAALLRADVAAAVLGDDSGLEVAALGGRPGVRSARYGGGLSWPERRRALLADVAAASRNRTARFVCALHYIDSAGREYAVEADVPGSIADAEAGEGGFSYDPIFRYEPAAKTFAELTEAEKNRISHRARAVGALLRLLAAERDAGNAGTAREVAP